MENVTLYTERTVMKFPADYITCNDIVNAIGNAVTIKYMSSVPSMTYSHKDALNFLDFLSYTRPLKNFLELGIFKKDDNAFL